MPSGATDILQNYLAAWNGTIAHQIYLLVCVVMVLVVFSDVIDALPMSLACVVRWKEAVHLSTSAGIMRKCFFASWGLSVPFVLICARHALCPALLHYCGSPWLQILAAFTVFVCYLVLRRIMLSICTAIKDRRRVNSQVLDYASKATCPFFMIGVIIMLLSMFASSFFNVDPLALRTVLLWEMAVFYGLMLLCKFQIFAAYRGIFAAFLYLCTLEIIPSGLLVLVSRM